MAQATNTTLGEIILAGDLAGSDANNPTLRASGVTPGTYSPVQRAHIDSKGRITWIGVPDYDTELAPYLPSASTTQEGLVVVGRRISVSGGTISVPDASTSDFGVVSIGSGLQINGSGQVEPIIPWATTGTKGIVQIGSNINVASGVISRAGWEDATTSSKGMVQIGTPNSGLSITSGLLSCLPATISTKGIVSIPTSPGSGLPLYYDSGAQSVNIPAASASTYGLIFGYTGSYLNIDGSGNLTLTIPPATTSALGLVSIGANLYITAGGELSLYPYASASVKGLVQIGTNIDVASGVISIPDATTSVKGVFNYDTNYFALDTGSLVMSKTHDGSANYGVVKSADTNNIIIVDGDINVGSNIPQKNTVNEFTATQVVTPATGTYAASYTPAFVNSNTIDLTLTGNITINNPSTSDYVAGGKYIIVLRQDATGGRTLTLGSNFKTNETITLSTAANAIDVLNIIARASGELFVIFNKGYA